MNGTHSTSCARSRGSRSYLESHAGDFPIGEIPVVGAGTKAEWRRNKSGMGENRRVEAWVARLGGGRSVAMASSEASGPRLAFFAPRLRIVAQLEGMKKSNFTTASLPSLSAAFSASSMPAPLMPPRRPDNSASPRPASTNCARLGRAAVRPSAPSPAAVPTGASGRTMSALFFNSLSLWASLSIFNSWPMK